MEWIPEGMALI